MRKKYRDWSEAQKARARAASLKFYNENRALVKSKNDRLKASYHAANTALLAEFREPGCAYCGSKEGLQAHHLRDKKRTIAYARWRNSPQTFREELAKCVPLCRNCHIALHKQRGDGRAATQHRQLELTGGDV